MAVQDDEEYKTLVFSDNYIQVYPDTFQHEGEVNIKVVLKDIICISSFRE